jgi:hypothetical protein
MGLFSKKEQLTPYQQKQKDKAKAQKKKDKRIAHSK